MCVWGALCVSVLCVTCTCFSCSQALLEASPKLESLDVRDGELGDAGVVFLCQALTGHTTLTYLNLSRYDTRSTYTVMSCALTDGSASFLLFHSSPLLIFYFPSFLFTSRFLHLFLSSLLGTLRRSPSFVHVPYKRLLRCYHMRVVYYMS